MSTMQAVQHEVRKEAGLDFDAIVIGAGVAGLYQLYRLRELPEVSFDDPPAAD